MAAYRVDDGVGAIIFPVHGVTAPANGGIAAVCRSLNELGTTGIIGWTKEMHFHAGKFFDFFVKRYDFLSAFVGVQSFHIFVIFTVISQIVA